jgi:hypothetical protein
MTNEQINEAIAKACGWDNDDIERGYTLCQFSEIVPDYCNDLNAMHEAEKIFDNALYCRYIDELCTQAIKGKNSMYLATAAQRAEAFLKTIGKWEGGTQ